MDFHDTACGCAYCDLEREEFSRRAWVWAAIAVLLCAFSAWLWL
jgi:hypothetical protein